MATIAEDRLLTWRQEFPILATTTHLCSHSMGAMPRGASDWLRRYADEWNVRGEIAWGTWGSYMLEHARVVGNDRLPFERGDARLHHPECHLPARRPQ